MINKVAFLKSIAKTTLNKFDCQTILNGIESMADEDFSLLEQHKINLLFLKHAKELRKTSTLQRKKIQQYSNQLFVLQQQYKEYLECCSKIFSQFEHDEIPYAVLKGFSFSQDLYKFNGIVYRSFADIDLLVPKPEATKVSIIVKNEGFFQSKLINDDWVQIPRSELIYWALNSHQLPEFIRPSMYAKISPTYWIEVDVNTTIFEGGKTEDPIQICDILRHCKKIMTNAHDGYYVLSPTYGLIQLCYHFYKDTIYESKKIARNDYCLIKFCDIREFVLYYRDQIDWDCFVEVVNNSNISNQIYYSLWVVSSFYGDLHLEHIMAKLNTTNAYIVDDLDWEKMLL